MSFQEIPILDLSLTKDANTRPQFLAELRHALINVGFLLIINYDYLDEDDFRSIKQQAEEFFALPEASKRACEMIHSPHFLGYNRLANEITALHTDWREQIDLATELPAPGKDEPLYRNIEGPNLWPDPRQIPQFRPTVENYIAKMTKLATDFRKLVAEAIGLPADALDGFFKPNQQCKMKLISYPDIALLHGKKPVAQTKDNDDPESSNQGCGAHTDSDLLTYIYQATDHTDSLQVQNFQGQWITVPNIPNSLVVNAGQTLEAITQGVCKATIHRVLIPKAGSGTRISIPFFQTIDLDSFKTAVSNIPPEVIKLKDERDDKIVGWNVNIGFQYKPDVSKHPVGYAVFRNRIKSHQDVAARWYPEILRQVLTEF